MLYVGLDHSLTAFGLAAVPSDWGLDFARVRRVTLSTKPGPAVARRAALAQDVTAWVKREAERARVPLTAVRVAVEGGIFMRDHANTIRSQERLVAVVEDRLAALGLDVAIAEQRQVRTLFLGPHQRKGAGELAQTRLRAMVGPSWDEAELDAFLVANHGLAEADEAFVTAGPRIDPEYVAREQRAPRGFVHLIVDGRPNMTACGERPGTRVGSGGNSSRQYVTCPGCLASSHEGKPKRQRRAREVAA